MLCNETFALALEPSIMMNNTGMSWQHVRLALKNICVDIDDHAVAWYHCRVVLAMTLLRRLGHGAMYIPSHAGDSAIKSCWWWCWRGDLAAARCRCRVMLAMTLSRWLDRGTWVMPMTMHLSHASDGAAKVTWPQHDVDVESYWWWCYRVMLMMTPPWWLGHDVM
jgi:hypothetical protein